MPGPLQLFDEDATVIAQLINLEAAAVSSAAHQELALNADTVSDAGNDTTSDNDVEDHSRHIPAAHIMSQIDDARYLGAV